MNILDERTKTDKDTQSKRILEVLKRDGKVTNTYLNNVMHIYRYSARIAELRADGYRIVANHIKGSIWEFIYKGHEDDDEPRVKEFDTGL